MDYPDGANISETDPRVRLEYGNIDESNRRFNNQLFLGDAFPDFIPQVVVPSDDVFKESAKSSGGIPVQAIEGKNWYQLIEEGKTPIEEHARIAVDTIKQFYMIWDQLGIIFQDRNTTNVIIGKDGKVYQVDFDAVKDVLSNKGVGIIDPSLSKDQRKLLMQDPQARKVYESERIVRSVYKSIITDLLDTLAYVVRENGDNQDRHKWSNVVEQATNNLNKQISSGASFQDATNEIFNSLSRGKNNT